MENDMLTPEMLRTIERDAAKAPSMALRLHARTLRAFVADTHDELFAQGTALLMKLEHMERCEVVAPAETEEYLAPQLMLMLPVQAMGAAA